MQPIDILVLSNGPGELTTWVRPVVQELRQTLGHDRSQVRISVVLSPCPNASGREVSLAQQMPEVDRVQGADRFFPFLLWGKTAESWEWRDRGVIIFLGGDQIFPVIIGRRLGYRTVIYGEWQTRWHRWIDRFGVMKPELVERADPRYQHKFTVVGDLMAEASGHTSSSLQAITQASSAELIGLLPGSKSAKLAQGVPLGLAIAQHIHAVRPQTQFVILVAPTLDLEAIAKYADPAFNPFALTFEGGTAELVTEPNGAYFKTASGLRIELWTETPAYDVLARCRLCLTTVGANTAELGSLAIPMIVLLPTQQLDSMRAWDGLPGLLANLPGVGSMFARVINGWFVRTPRLLAWPNIWAGEAIVPELIGKLQPQEVAAVALNWLEHPDQLEQVKARLQGVRGQAGAAHKLAQVVCDTLAMED
ncbi:lipid-A-disaccharide synthase [Oculatella sp. LEGE 06141]|uniref:lipid-A-disaccharide synthase n=1 Tax=Oculatella sp. LEGE 06141 TaxID=1828648 RepID=UPI00187E0059|nr:lipid-A-disaccharide synthase [Oculatella sp. LEGE 06141]MBE9178216.1 lipid-A-disaccharide synthase [Oculatella sp. LEGE 06141]